MQPSVEDIIATFGHRQLMGVVQAGQSLGFAPVTTLSTVLQIACMSLMQVAPAETVAILRAYADVIEAGPGEGPAQTAAEQRFRDAALAFVSVAKAQRDFPAPQGRA
jgi:hypothetical protein